MKKLIQKALLFSLCSASFALTSCYSSKVLVGDIQPNDPVIEVQSKWNHILLCGLIDVSKPAQASEYVGGRKNYVVKTNRSFTNYLVESITFGIYTPTQTKFYVPINSISK